MLECWVVLVVWCGKKVVILASSNRPVSRNKQFSCLSSGTSGVHHPWASRHVQCNGGCKLVQPCLML